LQPLPTEKIDIMASQLVQNTIHKAESMMAGQAGGKAAQLELSSVTPTTDSRITTDNGVKQSNTDDWLKVVNESHTGPMLLEDSMGREKVSIQLPSRSLTSQKLTRLLDPPI
jgi:catalase